MKRILLTFLAILYLGNSTGFAMHFHYCMDELVKANLVYNDLSVEGCSMHKNGNEKKDNDCCKDEVKTAKGDASQLTAEYSLKLIQVWAISLPLTLYEIPSFSNLYTDVAGYPTNNAPPNEQIIPVYLRNCVFRI